MNTPLGPVECTQDDELTPSYTGTYNHTKWMKSLEVLKEMEPMLFLGKNAGKSWSMQKSAMTHVNIQPSLLQKLLTRLETK